MTHTVFLAPLAPGPQVSGASLGLSEGLQIHPRGLGGGLQSLRCPSPPFSTLVAHRAAGPAQRGTCHTMMGGGDKLPRAPLERLSPKDREEHSGPVGSGPSGVRPGRPLRPRCHYRPGQRLCTSLPSGANPPLFREKSSCGRPGTGALW